MTATVHTGLPPIQVRHTTPARHPHLDTVLAIVSVILLALLESRVIAATAARLAWLPRLDWGLLGLRVGAVVAVELIGFGVAGLVGVVDASALAACAVIIGIGVSICRESP